MFTQIKLQRQFQVITLTKDQEKKLQDLGFSPNQIERFKAGARVVIHSKIFNPNNPDTFPWNSQLVDSKTIDQHESKALRLMEEVGLLEPGKSKELERQANSGSLDKSLKEKIEELQKALKADGKYSGEIDGNPGPLTQKAMNELILENAQGLINDSKQLERDQISENLIPNHEKNNRKR